MKSHLISPLIAAILAGVVAVPLQAQSAARDVAPPPAVPAAIEAVLQHATLAGARTGLLALTLPDRTVLVSRNADDSFAPASVTKLFTMAAALWKLGGHYVWRTPVAYRGTKREGRIGGDLWILGRGAPDLVEERLWIAAQWLAEEGLTEIDGDIVVDDRYFAGPAYGQGWPGGRQTSEAYHAPISALMANYAAQRGDSGWNAVADPPLHFGTRFAALLGKAGVRVRGSVRRPDAA